MRHLFLILMLILGNNVVAIELPVPNCAASKWHTKVILERERKQRQIELATAEQAFDDHAPERALAMNRVANAWLSSGDLARGEAMFDAALTIWEKSPTFSDSALLENLAYMADIASCREQWGLAENRFQQTVAAAKNLYGAKSDKVVPALLGLSGFYYSQHRFGEGEVVFKEADLLRLTAGKRSLVPPDVSPRKQISELYQKGKFAEAVTLAQEVIQRLDMEQETQYQILEQRQTELARLENPAKMLKAIPLDSEYNEQIAKQKLWNEALAKRNTAFWKWHGTMETLGTTVHILAELNHSNNEWADAEKGYVRAREIYQRVEIKDVKTGRLLSDMGLLYHAKGDFEKAKAMQQQALDIFLPELGSEHPDVLFCQTELASLNRSAK